MTTENNHHLNKAQEDCDPDTPHAKRASPQKGKLDQLADRDAEDRQEALVDEGVEETFPASDPVSVKRVN
ncbi:hypothetical protein GCM10009422_14400 [Brevundimonas kwangchunensis]|uniref:YfhD family protein n=1 Tax=Brevundimonas kwangchunensis TaxID=322163 RepID=A0ABP3RX07_9CAUL